ncbi:MAG TPA: hypothetical protein EYP14_14745, partial [Planctomycetaceae bacterium]|nr:hypothetical protein [Planctomycetaceae bacterium]
MSYLWRRWRDQITPAGKVLVGGVCLAAVGGISVELPIYQIFCALCLVLGLAEITGVFCYPFVELTAEFPDRAVVGEPVSGAVTIRNRSRWRPIFDLSVGFMGLPRSVEQLDADRTVRFLAPSESVRVTVTVRFARRGLCELPPLRAFSTFPFNLVRTGQRRLAVKPVLVLPAFPSLTRVDVPLRSLYQPGGAALTAKVGESL